MTGTPLDAIEKKWRDAVGEAQPVFGWRCSSCGAVWGYHHSLCRVPLLMARERRDVAFARSFANLLGAVPVDDVRAPAFCRLLQTANGMSR